jgi:external thioesterase TEII
MDKPQLFLIHFAGGSVYSFQYLKPFLTEFEFIPLELPGRGKRTREPFITDFYEAARDIADQLRKSLQSNTYLIYGHSMGALLALEVAKTMEKIRKGPSGIIVSGNAGPGTEDGKKRYLMETEEFKKELREIGGMPEEVMADGELFNYFIPMLKADFEILEKDEKSLVFSPVEAPVYAIMGDKEEGCEDISNWKNYTLSSFAYTILEGDHFFIYHHAQELARIMKAGLTKNLVLQK